MAVKGSFKDISLIELMQLMQLAHKTGRLEITVENKWAMLIFREGELWHVEPRGFRGMPPEEVVYTLISMRDGNFAFQRLQVLPGLDRSMTISMENLLMEGARRLDEDTVMEMVGEASEASSGQQVLRLKSGAEAKVRYAPQNTKRILAAINNERTLAEVIQVSQIEPTQAAHIIKDLLNQGVLETADGPRRTEEASANVG